MVSAQWGLPIASSCAILSTWGFPMTDRNNPTGEDPDEHEAGRTVMLDDGPADSADSAGPLHIVWRRDGDEHSSTFTELFTIGRDAGCDVSLVD